METYIALLRGINVGGNRLVPMAALKALFQEIGFEDVSTYIQSGNVIFKGRSDQEDAIRKLCADSIEARFGFRVPVALISAQELRDALDHAPVWWNRDTDAKHNAIFVIPPVSPEDVFQEVGGMKPEYEQADVYGRVIFWSAPVKTFSRTRLSRVVGSGIYDNITIRNANTTLKLRELTSGG
jgi:uncharacterized protein (DUF1697 family)